MRSDFDRVFLYVISCEEMRREKCWEEILREFCYGEKGMKKCEGGNGVFIVEEEWINEWIK